MPVDRTSNELDRDELNALRGISKGLLVQTITPGQTTRLKSLGLIKDNPGGKTGVMITSAGKAFLGK